MYHARSGREAWGSSRTSSILCRAWSKSPGQSRLQQQRPRQRQQRAPAPSSEEVRKERFQCWERGTDFGRVRDPRPSIAACTPQTRRADLPAMLRHAVVRAIVALPVLLWRSSSTTSGRGGEAPQISGGARAARSGQQHRGTGRRCCRCCSSARCGAAAVAGAPQGRPARPPPPRRAPQRTRPHISARGRRPAWSSGGSPAARCASRPAGHGRRRRRRGCPERQARSSRQGCGRGELGGVAGGGGGPR